MSDRDWRPELRRRLAGLSLIPAREAEIVDELSAHLEDRYKEHLASGKTETEARTLARAELDESDLLTTRLRHVETPLLRDLEPIGQPPRGAWLSGLGQDVRYGLRALRRSPASTLAALLMLALGTGVNTAMFSVVDAVFFQTLFRDSARIVILLDQRGSNDVVLNAPAAGGADLERLTTVFDSVSALMLTGPIMTTPEGPRRLQGECVQASMFRVLGIAPIAGRPFTVEEDRPGGDPVIVASNALARQLFGGAAAAVGRPLTLDGQVVTIVGVMGPRFAGVRGYRGLDLWAPLGQGADAVSAAGCDARFGGNFYARIRSDLTVASADARLAAITGGSRRLESLLDSTVGDDRATLEMLVAAVGFVLLIACANVANLLLDRAVNRRREVATRLALGASPGRLVRQVLTESVLLALLGTVTGVVAADLALNSLVALLPMGIPNSANVALDARVLSVALALGIAAGLLSGLVPARQASTRGLVVWLSDARAVTLPNRSWMKRLLVVTEVALSVALLVGAVLMIRSFLTLRPNRPGFDPAHKWVASLRLSGSRYQVAAAQMGFLDDFTAHLVQLPGVRGVSATRFAPFSGRVALAAVAIVGRSEPVSGRIFLSPITANYFDEMRMTMRRGRGFTAGDTAGSAFVVIVSETLARRVWPDGNAIGSDIRLTGPAVDRAPRHIVGVVSDIRTFGNTTKPPAQLYLPMAQDPSVFLDVIVRSADDATVVLGPDIRRAAAATDPTQVLDAVRPMPDLLDTSVASWRSVSWLMSGFAAMAIGLAAVGLVAVMGSTVAQRTQEIGIRMTLGAQPAAVVKLVLLQAVALSCAGVVIGLGLAATMTRLLSDYLYGVTPLDRVTFVESAALMVVVATAASYVPARRATKVDPLVALRAE